MHGANVDGNARSGRRRTGAEQLHAEQLPRVGPDGRHLEPRRRRQQREAVQGELVGDLGEDGLAGGEPEPLARHLHRLRRRADQVHLDAAARRVVEGVVREGGRIEAGIQDAVEMAERVEVERRRHPLPVIVGRFEHGSVLLQVHADEQAAARPDGARDAVQERHRLVHGEVADGGARKVGDPGTARGGRRQAHAAVVVGAQRRHLQRGVAVAYPGGGGFELSTAHVDGHVRRRGEQMIEQRAGLGAAAAAVLDEDATGADEPRHLRRGRGHDGVLGARGIVLLKAGDPLEQRGAALVVEQPAREPLLLLTQPFEHLRPQLVELRGMGRLDGRGPGVHRWGYPSFARRIPVNCQRLSGGKKFR